MASAMKESDPQPGKTSGEATEPPEQQSPYSLFRPWEKAFIISMTTVAGLASPLSSQIYYPALPILAQHYEKTMTLVNLTITTYMIVQGLAPSFVSTYADVGGRRPAYILAFTIYVGANLGLALQNSFGALMALRCLQSAGSSATVSLGYGVAADIASSGERGRYMGWMNAGFMAALPLGPVLGGVFVRWLGWRSIFWFLVVASGSFLVIYLVVMPETSRKLVGNGSLRPNSPLNMSLLQYICSHRGSTPDKSRYRFTWQFGAFNPLRSLAVFRDKSASITISSLGAMYALNIIFAASTANLFGSLYGLDSLGVGLCLLPLGIFGCIGPAIMGFFTDWNYRRVAGQRGQPSRDQGRASPREFPFERARLQIVFPLVAVVIACTIPYGWVLEQQTPLAVPLVLQAIVGFCGTASVSVLSALLVDLFPTQPATASAASNLVRCWLGAGAVAVLDSMLSGMGWGFTFCFLGLVLLATTPLLWVEYRWGMKWRMIRAS